MNDLVTGVVVTGLVLWTVTTLVQVHPAADRLYPRLGICNVLVPYLTYFAPHPGGRDYHVLYRDRLEDETVTDWREATELTSVSSHTPWIWNPDQYDLKVVLDIGRNLPRDVISAATSDSEDVTGDTIRSDHYVLSPRYLLVLNYVSNAHHHEDATMTQFALAASSHRSNEYELRFVSNYHGLNDA